MPFTDDLDGFFIKLMDIELQMPRDAGSLNKEAQLKDWHAFLNFQTDFNNFVTASNANGLINEADRADIQNYQSRIKNLEQQMLTWPAVAEVISTLPPPIQITQNPTDVLASQPRTSTTTAQPAEPSTKRLETAMEIIENNKNKFKITTNADGTAITKISNNTTYTDFSFLSQRGIL